MMIIRESGCVTHATHFASYTCVTHVKASELKLKLDKKAIRNGVYL